MLPSTVTLIVNGTLIFLGILMTITLLRMGAKFEYNYGRPDIRYPLQRKMTIILLVLIFMSFIAGTYNLLGPWLFGV